VNDIPVCIHRRCIRDVFRAAQLTSDIRRFLVFVAHAFCTSIRPTRSTTGRVTPLLHATAGELGEDEEEMNR